MSLKDTRESSNTAPSERSESDILNQTADNAAEQQELDAMLDDIRSEDVGTLPRKVRRFGLLIAFLTFVALGCLVMILIQDVPFETRVFGSKQWIPGQHISFRIALFEREKTRFLNHIQTQMWLVGNKRKKLLFQGTTSQNVLIANLVAPRWPLGKKYMLHVHASGPNGSERFQLPIELVKDPKPTLYAKENYVRLWESNPRLERLFRYTLYTEGRSIIADLSNRMLLRIQERIPQANPASQPTSHPTSKPVLRLPVVPKKSTSRSTHSRKLLQPFARPKSPSVTATQKKLQAKRKTWRTPKQVLSVSIREGQRTLGPFLTNEKGFVQIPYMPQFLQADWLLTITGPEGSQTFTQRLKPEGYQLLMELPQAVIPHGKPVPVRVESLMRKGDLHFDIIRDGQRIWSTRSALKSGKCSTQLKLPTFVKGLITLQVYSEFYHPGEVYDSRLLYIGKPTAQKLLTAVERHLSKRGDGLRILELDTFKKSKPTPQTFQLWAQRIFARVKARFAPPLTLYNSFDDRLRKLRSFQTYFRNTTLLGLGVLGSLVVLGIFIWLAWAYRRDRRAMLESEDEDVGYIDTRGLPWLFGFALILVLLFACILYLFFTMQWTYDNL